MQGCLPPDWSFCDCDFRDNFWNHVLNDIHLLWDGPNFIRKARDNSTFQGKYLQGPLPEGYNCPEQAVVFWKAWPQFGMSRGLIEGSMGDLWMPAARDRIKGICMAGHLALCVICSQHFLVKAARAIEAGQPDHMRWMEAAYGHMVAIRNLGHAHQLRNCMGQQGWPLKVAELHGYAEKWLGREAVGTSPMAAYFGGQIDPYQMLFDQPMAHTEKSRLDSLPDRRPCVPYKNPQCWKRMSKLLIDTCEHCCSPFIHKSGRGDPWCFDGVWTYERCCQTDFMDLVCEMKRSGEEGGCVDCQKSVHYTCLTPPEKRLQDAQNNYNSKVDKYNSLQADAQRLSKEVSDARADLAAKDGVYQEKYNAFDQRLQTWNRAFNNRTRLLAEVRSQQQRRTWNASAQALEAAQAAARSAQGGREAAEAKLRAGRAAEAEAQETVARNASALATAAAALGAAREQLLHAQALESEAAAAEVAAAALAARAAAAEAVQREGAWLARRALDELRAEAALGLDGVLAKQRTSEATVDDAALIDAETESDVLIARKRNSSAYIALETASAAVIAAEAQEMAARDAEQEAGLVLNGTEQQLLQYKTELQSVEAKETSAHEALLARTVGSAAVRCLIAKTPGNLSARPQLVREANVSNSSTCKKESVVEDENEFCTSWARAGECERNPEYMRQSCGRSCSIAPDPCSAEATTATEVIPVDADLVLLVSELLAIAASLPSAAEQSASGKGQQPRVAVASEDHLGESVRQAAAALGLAREHEQSAEAAMAGAEKVLGTAERAHEEVVRLREGARRAHIEAASRAALADGVVQGWLVLVSGNETAVSGLQDSLDARQDEHRQLQAAASQAVTLEQGLGKARSLAEEAAARKREAVARASRRCEALADHVRTLNASVSENLTTAVATWLLADGGAERPAPATGWVSRLLGAAKDVVVSLVGSIEAFLETYVVSLTDRETITELFRAVEDQKAASLHLSNVEVAASDAERQSQDAESSFAKAEASRKAAEESAKRAAGRVTDAEETLRAAEELLEQAKSGFNASKSQLDEMQSALKQRDAELQDANAAVAVAAATVKDSKDGLRGSREVLETAKAEIVEATFALAVAEGSRAAAEARALDAYFAELQQQCEASEAEFEAYLRERELLSLLRAVVAHRAQAHEATASWHAQAQANHSAATAARAAAADAASDARLAHRSRALEAAAADGALGLRIEARARAGVRLALARAALEGDRTRVAGALEPVHRAEATLGNATAEHAEAASNARRALERHAVAIGELQRASNTTESCSRAVESLEAAETQAMQAWIAAKTWLVDFVAALLLDARKRAVEVAAAEERELRAVEARKSRRERQMKALLETHERRLQLLNSQLSLPEKETQRVRARDEFKQAEQALLDAQNKLEKLTENEATTHDNIGKTYKELDSLLEEHRLATEGYNKQDPEERKRSFSTKLSGTGPDPNGIDVR